MYRAVVEVGDYRVDVEVNRLTSNYRLKLRV